LSDEADIWLSYACENLEVAALALNSGLFNSVLQNSQQAIEKSLKAAMLIKGEAFPRSHNIRLLRDALNKVGGPVDLLSNEECALFDSVFLHSKYPPDSTLPDYRPDEDTARKCLEIASRVFKEASRK
jgi:HEPN domain-containing protein